MMFKIAEYNFILPYVINIIEGETLSKLVIPLPKEDLDEAFRHIGVSSSAKTAFYLFKDVKIKRLEAHIFPPFFKDPKSPEKKRPSSFSTLGSGEVIIGANNLKLEIMTDIEDFETSVGDEKNTFASGLNMLTENFLDDLLGVIRWKTGQYWIGQHKPTHVFYIGHKDAYFDEEQKMFLSGLHEEYDLEIGDTDRSTPLREKEWLEIKKALCERVFQQIYDELLLDAQHLLFRADDIRRAILDAAMSCEVYIKSYIVKNGGAIYQYLVEKKIIRILEYLDDILNILKGKSLRKENKDLYDHIELLFQVRNNIVHKGECVYFSNEEQRKLELDWGGAWTLIEKVKELIEWMKNLN